MTDQRLIIGIDGGGTSTRVRVARLDGTTVAAARGGGVNPNSGSDPRASLTAVIEKALGCLTPDERSQISAGAAGLAGYLSNPDTMTDAANAAWQAAGLTADLTVCSDLVVAYWSAYARGGNAPEVGAILVAGTGAVAAVVGGTATERIIDGFGYFLGDYGAGAWLGAEVARAALDSATGRGPETLLEGLVFNGADPQAWLGQFYSRPPRDVASLSLLLDRAHDAGDEVAHRIVDRAVAELSRTADAAVAGHDMTQIVVAGSIAAGENPVGQGLRGYLARRGLEVSAGIDGLDGAVELAARKVQGIWPMI